GRAPRWKPERGCSFRATGARQGSRFSIEPATATVSSGGCVSLLAQATREGRRLSRLPGAGSREPSLARYFDKDDHATRQDREAARPRRDAPPARRGIG